MSSSQKLSQLRFSKWKEGRDAFGLPAIQYHGHSGAASTLHPERVYELYSTGKHASQPSLDRVAALGFGAHHSDIADLYGVQAKVLKGT